MSGRGKSRRNINLIASAFAILEEIHPATVRAVCYQLFTRGLIGSMAKNETNKVSTQLRDAREAGTIPWSWIVDETREPETISAWENPAAYFDLMKRAYRRNYWSDQPQRIEIWSEKGTIRGTLAPVLERFGITFRVMHGYGSATAIHQAADDSMIGDKVLTVLYLGDWDPSGLHMSVVDLPARITSYGGYMDLERLALTEEDTTAGLPSFAAETKRKDPRYRWFVKNYGSTCWELDALSPVVLRDRVERAIEARLDVEAWTRAIHVERVERDSITSILNTWPGISRPASECDGRPQA